MLRGLHVKGLTFHTLDTISLTFTAAEEQALAAVLAPATGLTALSLSRFDRESETWGECDADWCDVLQHMRQLQRLELPFVVSERSALQLTALSCMGHLCIQHGRPGIDTDVAAALLTSMPQLQYVHLQRCALRSAAPVFAAAACLSGLTVLRLPMHWDEGMVVCDADLQLRYPLTQLQQLWLPRHEWDYSEAAREELHRQLPSVKQIWFDASQDLCPSELD